MDQPPRILVVDDRHAARWLLVSSLRHHGYEAVEAADGPAALEALATGGFDGVLLNSQLPGMSGLAVLKRIRSAPSPVFLPVLFFTGDPTSESMLSALEHGASDYLVQPVVIPILHARLASHVSRRRAEQAAQDRRRDLEAEVQRRTADLQRTNAALQESERRFQSLADTAPVAIFRSDAAGRCFYVNPRWTAMTGLTLAQSLGDGWWSALHPEDHDRVVGACEEALRSGVEFGGEFRLLSAGGATTWVQGQAAAERDAEGRVSGLVGTLTDISLRRAAEDTVRAGRQLLQNVIDSFPQRVGVRDREGRFLVLNAILARDFPEMRRGETYLQAAERCHGDPDRAEWLRHLAETDARVLATGVPEEVADHLELGPAGDERLRRFCIFPLVDPDGGTTGVVTWSEDVTGRVQAEQELRYGRRLLQNVIDSFPQRVAVRDMKTGFVYRNTAALRDYRVLFGQAAETDPRVLAEAPGTPEDLRGVYAEGARLMDQVLRTGRAAELPEYSMPGPGGAPTVRRLVVFPLMDSGAVTGVVNWSEDITERARSQQELRNSRQLLQDMIDSFPHRISVLDRDGRFRIVNTALAKVHAQLFGPMLGRTQWEAAEAVGPGPLADKLREYARLCAAVAESGVATEVRQREAIGAPGEPHLRHLRIFPLFDTRGNAKGVVTVSEDITERLRAEENLEGQRQLLQNVIDSFPQRIAVRDRDGQLLFRNAALVRDYEALFASSEGAGVRELANHPGVSPEVQESLRLTRDLMDQVVATGKPAELPQYSMPGLDGKPTIRRMVSFPLFDAQGAVRGEVSWSEDITDRLQTERSLRQAMKMEALGRLTGGIAHDFSNVLQVVRGYVQLALEELGRPSHANASPGVTGHLKHVLESTEQGSSLTRQLLTFSLGGDLNPQPIDLNRHLQERLDILRMAVGKTVQVELLTARALEPVLADPGMLDQVLLNLSLNARDAMPSGGELRIETRMVQISDEFLHPPAWAKAEHYARITVRDTGTGITPEVRERLFEPFFTTKGDGRGTGLGLSVVHGIVRQHNGEILVESIEDKGTAFHVYLPLCDRRSTGKECPTICAGRVLCLLDIDAAPLLVAHDGAPQVTPQGNDPVPAEDTAS